MRGSVIKRGKTYTIIYDKGINPKTGNRKQKTKGGFKYRKDAEAALRKILKELDDNPNIPSEESFSSFTLYWYEDYKTRVSKTTADSRWHTINKHLIRENPFADKPISKIHQKEIDDLLRVKIESGLSTSTVNKVRQLLNLVFQQALNWEMINKNPMIKSRKVSVKTKKMQIWTYEEIHKFLTVCKTNPLYLLYVIALYTGMRKGEILGLKWRDIDYTRKIIRVQRSLARTNEKTYIYTDLKNTSSFREIPIPDFVLKELLNHKKLQEEWKKRFGEQYQDNNLVICEQDGSHFGPRKVGSEMKTISTTANVTQIRFHDLRHTHASILISEGVDIVKVSARLGHANPRTTTQTYAHLVASRDYDVADIFHNVLEVTRPDVDI